MKFSFDLGPGGCVDLDDYEAQAAWDALDEDAPELETKARYVRTPEGVRHFKRPLGSPILARVPDALERDPEAEQDVGRFLDMMDRRAAEGDEEFGNAAAVLKAHGRFFTPAERPDDVAPATPKMCFQNAFQLAMSRPDLTYVEGFALSVVPLHHAWCVTDDGVVVDPTWTGGNGLDPGAAYYGVPLTRDALVREALRSGRYGVFGHGNYDFWSRFDAGDVEAVAGPETKVRRDVLDALVAQFGGDASALVGYLEKSLRRVRTPEGAHHYDLPIGAIIRPDAGVQLPIPLALADLLPPSGETAAAKANVESVNDLIGAGWDPAAAVKEHKRLVHNEAVKLIRARQKAEKAKQQDQATPKEKAGVTPEDLLKQVAQFDFGQAKDKTDDELAEIAADIAAKVAGEEAPTPKALYDYRPGKENGPGASSSSRPWHRRVPSTYKEGDEPIPVVGLTVGGHKVEHGVVVRRGDVMFLLETNEAAPSPEELTRLNTSVSTVNNVLKTVPEGSRHYLQGISLLTGPNPKDAYWAQKYNVAGFHSAATGGHGAIEVWDSHKSAVQPTTIAHEFGHNVDSQVWLAHQYLSDADGPKLPNTIMSWSKAMSVDSGRSRWVKEQQFTATRPGGHPITLGENHVTDYGSKSLKEDFAESVRLYLKDRREGKIGFLKPKAGQSMGTNVRFADVWPERARVLDAAFGVKSEYETEAVKALRAEILDVVADERHAQMNTGVTSSAMKNTPLKLQETYGVNAAFAHDVYGKGVQLGEQKWADAVSQKKLQAVDSLYASMMSNLSAEQPEHNDEQLKYLAVAKLKNAGVPSPSPHDVDQVVGDAKQKFAVHKQKLEAEEALSKATADAAEAALSLLTIEDLPADDKKKIRKKKAAVKFYAKKGGATTEEAQKAADEYETAAVQQRLQELGIKGAEDVGLAKAKAAGQTPGKLGVAEPTHKHGALTKAKDWLQRAGKTKADHAKQKYSSYNVDMQAKDNIVGTLAWKLAASKTDWDIFRSYVQNAKGDPTLGGNGYGVPSATPVPGPFENYTQEQRHALMYEDVNKRIACWAGTAGDSSPAALMMQHAVKDEFGLKADWGQRFLVQGTATHYTGGSQKLLQDVTTSYPKVSPWFRRVVRTMYDHTQEEFAKEGIKQVALWRGMHIPTTLTWSKTGEHRAALQPANSWSTSKAIAHRFGPKMLKATFPVTLVLGSARTGFGCLNEQEFVVLDADGLIRVEPYNSKSYY